MKTILSYFFHTLLPPKITFTSSENKFFSKSVIPTTGNLFSVYGSSMLFFSEPFFCCWNHNWNYGEPILKENGNHFQFFCQRKQFFFQRILETYFSTNSSFRVVETDFLASTNHNFFSRLVETYFLTNPSFQLLEKDFWRSVNHILY